MKRVLKLILKYQGALLHFVLMLVDANRTSSPSPVKMAEEIAQERRVVPMAAITLSYNAMGLLGKR